jgi:hypothetical protein
LTEISNSLTHVILRIMATLCSLGIYWTNIVLVPVLYVPLLAWSVALPYLVADSKEYIDAVNVAIDIFDA